MIFQLEMMIFQLKLGLWSQSNDRDGRNRVRFTSIFHRFSIDFSSIFHRFSIDFPSIFDGFSQHGSSLVNISVHLVLIWCWFGVGLVLLIDISVDFLLIWCSWLSEHSRRNDSHRRFQCVTLERSQCLRWVYNVAVFSRKSMVFKYKINPFQ